MTTLRTVLAVILVGVLLAGCEGGPPDPAGGALVVVAGAHANASAPAVPPGADAAVEAAARDQPTAAVIVSSGRPEVVEHGPLPLECRNRSSCAAALTQNVQAVAAAVSGARAGSAEVDLLGSLHLAARVLADDDGPRTLVVLDTGLQTVPPLAFQNPGTLQADPRDVVGYLESTSDLPDLTGVVVHLAGIGDTHFPQPPLDPAQRSDLLQIWEAVLVAAGAEAVHVEQTPLTGAPVPDLPPVTVVPVDAPVALDGRVVDLPESVVPFEPDTAVLRDPDSARVALVALAERITGEHSPVHLIGATASVGSPAGRRDLGAARADAVRRLLIEELGVPGELVTTEGVGSDWPGHITDVDADGRLMPDAAALNRRVLARFEEGGPP